jgi:hypothetical protein
MIAVCKKGTKRLVKGVRYEILNLWNDGTNQKWREGKLQLKDIGTFSVDNFADDNGKPLPKINIIAPLNPLNRLEFDKLKEGDIIVCETDNYKTLASGVMYKIEKLIEKSEQKTSWNNSTYIYKEQKIKFVGINRTLKFNSWGFRNLTPTEAREISLNKILHNQDAEVMTTSDIRKIELCSNKNLELMKVLSRSIIDPNRHHLSIIEWACVKVGDKLRLESSDYDSIMNMSLKDILSSIETK